MGIAICSDTGCITQKYTFCGASPVLASGPCASELVFTKSSPGGSPLNETGYAYGENTIYSLTPNGTPFTGSCSLTPFPAGKRSLAYPSAPADGGFALTRTPAVGSAAPVCDGPVGICPGCAFIELGINLCAPESPTAVFALLEEAVGPVAAVGTCRRLWIAHLTCPWKGDLCIQFCCDDYYGA
jgi:hypothetical protein